jgi:KTSC domain
MPSAACDSTLLKAAAYHAQFAVLELTFHSGAVYRYFGVPPQIYNQLLRAQSKGRYFNSHIRNRFKFTKSPPPQGSDSNS